ncbi:MAG: hypothetical protein AAGI72_11940 [Pseudomonadota bacterium]
MTERTASAPPADQAQTSKIATVLPSVLAGAVVCLGLIGVLRRPGLAGDEMWGAMHANLSLLQSLVFTLRYDLHPPIYYFQLVVWSLPFRGDLWLLLNSVAWTALTAVLLAARFRHRIGTLPLTAVCTCMVLSPLLAKYTIELRMYSMLACLSLASFLAAERCINNRAQSSTAWTGYVLINLLAIYSHAAGFLITLGAGSWLILALLKDDRFYRALFVNAGLALCSAPVFMLSLLKSVSHTTVPSLIQMAKTPLDIFIADTLLSGPVGFIAIPVAALLVLVVLSNPASRSVLLCGVFLPFLTCAAISVLAKPMWLARNFIIVVPVFYFAVARCLESTDGPALSRRLFPLLLGMLLSFNLIALPRSVERDTLASKEVVREFSGFLEERDCVAVRSNVDIFWGFARYFGHPASVNALVVQGPPASERWVSVLERLRESRARPAAEALGLLPTQSDLILRDVLFSIGATEPRWPRESCNRWLVVRTFDTWREAGKAPELGAEHERFLVSADRFALYELTGDAARR